MLSPPRDAMLHFRVFWADGLPACGSSSGQASKQASRGSTSTAVLAPAIAPDSSSWHATERKACFSGQNSIKCYFPLVFNKTSTSRGRFVTEAETQPAKEQCEASSSHQKKTIDFLLLSCSNWTILLAPFRAASDAFYMRLILYAPADHNAIDISSSFQNHHRSPLENNTELFGVATVWILLRLLFFTVLKKWNGRKFW